jgi:signal transduction histidine kinase
MLLGYMLMHPFAMLTYLLGHQHSQTHMAIDLWGMQISQSFSVEGLAMGGAFAFMGGLAGFFFGIWYFQKEKLAAERLDFERRQVALETLQELMVTLAHHIRNANVVIGGFSSRMIKHLPDPEMQRQLHLIQQASREIDAVIGSLESLTEVRLTQYTGAWETKMFDLKQELEARMAAFEAPKELP